jgi:hypothetical protein
MLSALHRSKKIGKLGKVIVCCTLELASTICAQKAELGLDEKDDDNASHGSVGE